MPNQNIRPPPETGGSASSVLRTALTVLLFAAAFGVVQLLAFALRFPLFQRTTIWTLGAPVFTALLVAPPAPVVFAMTQKEQDIP